MRLSNGVRWLALATAIFASGQVAAQSTATLSGRVMDESGAALSGVQIVITHQVSGAQTGALSQSDGRYTVPGLRPGGPYRIEARMIGYGLQLVDDVNLLAGQTRTVDFRLGQEAIAIDAIEVFATRATPRKTPVAFTDVPKVQIQNQLGSRDLPMVLNVTPSVYATPQGGGAGDARINVRGFSQRNTAVMINGVPVNDMENGWVYWSNWDGLGDASTSIQLQRGLSAINLATPSIGGTLNVITDPTSVNPGFSYKQEFGLGALDSDDRWSAGVNLMKETFVVNTGEQGGFAMTASVVRKTGSGMYRGFFGGDATWTDAWAYYMAARYQINARNRVELYAVGAPQRHGQNLYKLNIGTISHDFASSLDDYDQAALADFPEAGRRGSPNVAPVATSYSGQQYSSTGPDGGSPTDRYDEGFINERENYFHKPQVNLNWYSYLGSGLTLSTVAYYSGGDGGGTGTYGSSSRAEWRYDFTQRVPDWDGTIANNIARGAAGSGYILRNSVNNQWTIGAISKLRKDYESGWTSEVGLDWRTAEIDHYREVRDLLGGSHYDETFSGSDFWSASEISRGLGDKINYDNTNKVDWLGAYVQAEKTDADGSFYGMFGWAQNRYDFTDHFTDDGTGNPLNLNSGWISGFQAKGGVNRNVTDEWSLFGNVGYVSKVPIFDGVIDDINGVKIDDPQNEKFLSFELGANYRSLDRGISFDANVYHTTWNDRANNMFVRDLFGNGEDGLVRLLGVDATHMGVEMQLAYQPNDLVRFDVAGSVGNWKYNGDVDGQFVTDMANTVTYQFYLDGLKIADAPQTQFAYSASFFPVDGAYLSLIGRTYANHYAEFDPFDRTEAASAGVQSWKAPGYTVFDANLSYRLGDLLPAAGDLRVFANIYNVFDKLYIQDAVDNSSFNGFDDDHDADDAEVFMGYPRNLNIGFQVNF